MSGPRDTRRQMPLRRWADVPGFGQRTLVMGVINVTEDSFSGDGLIEGEKLDLKAAVAVATQQVADGADILDIGAESSRPGAPGVDDEVEAARAAAVVSAVHAATDVPISIDTCKARVAEAALRAGAAIINDIWALAADPEMAGVAVAHEALVVLMHNRSRADRVSAGAARPDLGRHYVDIEYDDVVGDVTNDLAQRVADAEAAGIARERILLDPGIGFGKTIGQNLDLLNRLDGLAGLGLPLLVGPSRKSFIGHTLDLPPDDRVEGTAAAVAMAIARGAAGVRVHDVRAMARVARMTDAIVRPRQRILVD